MGDIDNNKLIANFMGIDTNMPHDHQGIYLYHKSWDWLMPVFFKIRQSILTNKDHSWFLHHWLEDELTDLNLKKLYSNIISYIRWYNKQKE